MAGDADLRVETIAEDYGAAERLAVVATHRGTWRGVPVVVRGGFPLDAEVLGELSDLMGAEVALRDTARGRWVARADSPLAQAAFDPAKRRRHRGHLRDRVPVGGRAPRARPCGKSWPCPTPCWPRSRAASAD